MNNKNLNQFIEILSKYNVTTVCLSNIGGQSNFDVKHDLKYDIKVTYVNSHLLKSENNFLLSFDGMRWYMEDSSYKIFNFDTFERELKLMAFK